MTDRYLYFQAALQGHRGALPPDAAELLAGLLAVARDEQADGDGFAAALLATLSTHPALGRIGRVCLAQQAPDAPLLHVIGSANRGGIPTGELVAGYHCFIADGSSLTALQEGRMRVFADATAVVASFTAAGRPPQRTIRLVAGMGMRAGLCLPLSQGGGRGYLFINTIDPGVFDRPDPSLAMPLAFLAQIARGRLHAVPADLVGSVPRPARPCAGGSFAAAVDELARCRWGVPTGPVEVEPMELLWSPGPALAAVAAGIEALAVDPARVAVRVRPAGRRHAEIELDPGVPPALPGLPGRAARAQARLAAWAVSCTAQAGDRRILLRVPADQDFHHEPGPAPVAYSI